MTDATGLTTLFSTLNNLRVSNFNAVSAAALLVYEVLVTQDQEYDYLWGSSRSLLKIPYIVIRYYALIFMCTNLFFDMKLVQPLNTCNKYLHFELWSLPLFVLLVDLLIVLRIYALYARRFRVGILLLGLWLVEATIVITVLVYAYKPFTGPTTNILPGILPSCLSGTTPPNYQLTISFWSITSAFQAIYIAITMLRFFKYVQTFGFTMTPLVTIIFRDGAGYFVIILGINLLNVLLEKLAPISLQSVGYCCLIALTSLAASRLILNMRSVITVSPIRRSACAMGNSSVLVIEVPTV